jgi:hypothetical protein
MTSRKKIACPVINATSSLVNNKIAPVTFSGSPSRLIVDDAQKFFDRCAFGSIP